VLRQCFDRQRFPPDAKRLVDRLPCLFVFLVRCYFHKISVLFTYYILILLFVLFENRIDATYGVTASSGAPWFSCHAPWHSGGWLYIAPPHAHASLECASSALTLTHLHETSSSFRLAFRILPGSLASASHEIWVEILQTIQLVVCLIRQTRLAVAV
jgi:hypothetical protein